MSQKTTLVIVESPAKAKTIEKYLGKGYKVMASVGHVRDLPKSNKDAVDIENGFIPKYVTTPGKGKVISDIKQAAATADEVLLATDPDREGEAIAWHLKEVADLDKAKRVVFHEITKEAVQEAVEKPRTIDDDLRKAQEARRVLDRLVGYDLSGLIWKKVRYGLSAGRVQSPALRILMEREREIRAFIPDQYFTITADFTTQGKEAFTTECSIEPTEEKEAERIVSVGKKGTWNVSAITETPTKRSPKPPFTTSTLQQTASTRLGFSPARTMGVAQKLYEAGHITYMRTDSTTLAASAINALKTHITNTYGKEYLETRTYKGKSKNAQEAHEAIRPTDVTKTAAGLNEEQKRLYTLIHSRTVASQMRDAQMLRTKIALSTDGVPDFTVNGSVLTDEGWLKADPEAKGEDTILPKMTTGETATLTEIESEERYTQPPKRYTEAGLVKELEKRGIGRPSTYASIMKTIIDRGYVTKEGRTLTPTATGDVVSSFLEKHFEHYVSDSFTAEMEDKLDHIAEGEREYAKTLQEFYTPFTKALESKADIPKLTTLGPAPKEFHCPLCGASMEMKLSRSGVFMSCSKFPDCTGARTEEGQEIGTEDPIGNHPELDKPIYIRNGRFGPYVEMVLEEEKESISKTGKKRRIKAKTKRASIPPEMDAEHITLQEAVKLLILPRELGEHPETGNMISANIGRYGPYVVHDGDFRSLKEDDPYTITFDRALEILKEPKKGRKGIEVVRTVGPHPRTKKPITLYKSKRGFFLKKGFKHILLDPKQDPEKLTPEVAAEMIKNG
ncbi:MAG: type I DNA topoisomerase [Patescibacteria group bacterium UBA2163]